MNCPECGAKLPDWRNPIPTVDIIIELEGGIVLIERKNPPHGWALPGGFVDYGESFEDAARREAAEETGLIVTLMTQLHTYSDPNRKGETIIVEVNDGSQSTRTVILLYIHLDQNGKGSTTWTLPMWWGASFNAPGVIQATRIGR